MIERAITLVLWVFKCVHFGNLVSIFLMSRLISATSSRVVSMYVSSFVSRLPYPPFFALPFRHHSFHPPAVQATAAMAVTTDAATSFGTFMAPNIPRKPTFCQGGSDRAIHATTTDISAAGPAVYRIVYTPSAFPSS